MNIAFIVDVLYEDNQKNAKKREILKKMLSEGPIVNSRAMVEWCKNRYGAYGRNLFYSIVARLVRLGLIEKRRSKRGVLLIFRLNDFIQKFEVDHDV
ncbi:MAG: hypothetical protein ACTSR2_01185 [Candidatus Hodarchaeales archaeon]